MAHINVFYICGEDIGAGDFAVHTGQSVILPTVEQQSLPFSLQGKVLTQAIHSYSVPTGRTTGLLVGMWPKHAICLMDFHLLFSLGIPIRSFVCLVCIYVCIYVYMCMCVILACAHMSGNLQVSSGRWEINVL